MPADGRIEDAYGGELDPRRRGTGGLGARGAGKPTFWDIAAIGGRQRGQVAHRQLIELGFSERSIGRMLASGQLHRVHRGVYAVGHAAITPDGRLVAAVLATGPGAVLSHRSAAALLGLRSYSGGAIDTMIAARGGRANPGLRIHRVTALHDLDRRIERGIPCTSVVRTLIDLAAILSPADLDRAIERAAILRSLDLNAAMEAIHRFRGHRGVARLRAALERYLPDSEYTRSEFERRFLALCRDAALPAPSVNVLIEVTTGFLEVDFSWRAYGLIAETDGFETHGTRIGQARDAERGQLLAAAGWQVVHFTWDQVKERDRAVAILRTLLHPSRRRAS